MKKLLSAAIAGSMLLSATPAFACAEHLDMDAGIGRDFSNEAGTTSVRPTWWRIRPNLRTIREDVKGQINKARRGRPTKSF